MSKFKYLGKDNTLVGRFGRLKHGQVVDLWETEAEYVLAHPSDPPVWAPVKSSKDDTGVGEIVPKLTKHFDLTRVFWLREAYAFLSRQSRSELLAMARGFREVGASVKSEEDCQSMSREALKEMLYGEAKRLKWIEDKPAHVAVITRRPVAKPEETEPEQEEEEAEGSEPEADEESAEESEEESEEPTSADEQPEAEEAPAPKAKKEKPPVSPKKGTYREIRRNR